MKSEEYKSVVKSFSDHLIDIMLREVASSGHIRTSFISALMDSLDLAKIEAEVWLDRAMNGDTLPEDR